MSVLWRGKSLSSQIGAAEADLLCSMLNLMEGIIPEYDRKGKVRIRPYEPSPQPTPVLRFRFEVRLDPQ